MLFEVSTALTILDKDATWLVSALMILFMGGGFLVALWEYLSVRRETKRDERPDEDEDS